ncbi:MAG: hypothetical protein SVM86_05325, partial [Candidatus Cloacimonadota bacterium]|nr:hypothetical protein [Candidatus Cloacimonadota bacterium]
IDANDYRKIINNVIVFLEGDCSKLLKYDHKKAIKSASDKMEYEKANILKNSEGFLKWFCKKMKFYHNFKTFTTVLSTKNLNFLFHKGQLVQKFSGSLDEEEIDFLTGEVIGNMDDRYILDRAKIIYNWLQNHNDSIRFL